MGIYKYYALEDYDGALIELTTAREQEPNDWAAVYFIALVQRRQGKLDEAIRGLQQAATLDPLNQDILVNLATTYRGMRRFDEARAMFDRALTLAANDSNILAGKAETYLAQGDLDTAGGIVSKLKVSPEDSDFGIYMGILAQRRQFDEMLAQSQTILENEKNHSAVVLQIARAATAVIHFAKGDRTGALPLVERARRDSEVWRKQKKPIPVLYHFNIIMEAQLGNRVEVESLIEELFNETRNDKWEFPNSEATAAAGYILLGDFGRAFPLLQDALSRPSSTSITISYLKLDPVFDSARQDPRFKKLIEVTP
jgi:tetratricopeptide (TPR) repeat protein